MPKTKEHKKSSHAQDAQVFVVDRKCDEKGMRVTNFDKWLIAVVIGVVFLILASPIMFRTTNSITSLARIKTTKNGTCPTYFGLFLHTAIFILIVRLLMH